MTGASMRLVEAMEQNFRVERDKLALQLAIYRAQLVAAGVEPDDRTDDDLFRLWRAAANSVSAASAFVAELGTGKELIDPKLAVRELTRT